MTQMYVWVALQNLEMRRTLYYVEQIMDVNGGTDVLSFEKNTYFRFIVALFVGHWLRIPLVPSGKNAHQHGYAQRSDADQMVGKHQHKGGKMKTLNESTKRL